MRPWSGQLLIPMFRTIHDWKPGMQPGHFSARIQVPPGLLRRTAAYRTEEVTTGAGEPLRLRTFEMYVHYFRSLFRHNLSYGPGRGKIEQLSKKVPYLHHVVNPGLRNTRPANELQPGSLWTPLTNCSLAPCGRSLWSVIQAAIRDIGLVPVL